MLVKTRISAHQGSSPTQIFHAVEHLAKGVEEMAHQITLLKAEAHNLRRANKVLSKRRRAKKTRVRQGGVLTIEDANALLAQKEVEKPVSWNRRESNNNSKEQQATIRRCSNCGKSGHNTRTCQVDEVMSNVHSSE